MAAAGATSSIDPRDFWPDSLGEGIDCCLIEGDDGQFTIDPISLVDIMDRLYLYFKNPPKIPDDLVRGDSTGELDNCIRYIRLGFYYCLLIDHPHLFLQLPEEAQERYKPLSRLVKKFTVTARVIKKLEEDGVSILAAGGASGLSYLELRSNMLRFEALCVDDNTGVTSTTEVLGKAIEFISMLDSSSSSLGESISPSQAKRIKKSIDTLKSLVSAVFRAHRIFYLKSLEKTGGQDPRCEEYERLRSDFIVSLLSLSADRRSELIELLGRKERDTERMLGQKKSYKELPEYRIQKTLQIASAGSEDIRRGLLALRERFSSVFYHKPENLMHGLVRYNKRASLFVSIAEQIAGTYPPVLKQQEIRPVIENLKRFLENCLVGQDEIELRENFLVKVKQILDLYVSIEDKRDDDYVDIGGRLFDLVCCYNIFFALRVINGREYVSCEEFIPELQDYLGKFYGDKVDDRSDIAMLDYYIKVLGIGISALNKIASDVDFLSGGLYAVVAQHVELFKSRRRYLEEKRRGAQEVKDRVAKSKGILRGSLRIINTCLLLEDDGQLEQSFTGLSGALQEIGESVDGSVELEELRGKIFTNGKELIKFAKKSSRKELLEGFCENLKRFCETYAGDSRFAQLLKETEGAIEAVKPVTSGGAGGGAASGGGRGKKKKKRRSGGRRRGKSAKAERAVADRRAADDRASSGGTDGTPPKIERGGSGADDVDPDERGFIKVTRRRRSGRRRKKAEGEVAKAERAVVERRVIPSIVVAVVPPVGIGGSRASVDATKTWAAVTRGHAGDDETVCERRASVASSAYSGGDVETASSDRSEVGEGEGSVASFSSVSTIMAALEVPSGAIVEAKSEVKHVIPEEEIAEDKYLRAIREVLRERKEKGDTLVATGGAVLRYVTGDARQPHDLDFKAHSHGVTLSEVGGRRFPISTGDPMLPTVTLSTFFWPIDGGEISCDISYMSSYKTASDGSIARCEGIEDLIGTEVEKKSTFYMSLGDGGELVLHYPYGSEIYDAFAGCCRIDGKVATLGLHCESFGKYFGKRPVEVIRVVKFIREAAYYGFEIDPAVSDHIKLLSSMHKVMGERLEVLVPGQLGLEVTKLFLRKKAYDSMLLMKELGVLPHFLNRVLGREFANLSSADVFAHPAWERFFSILRENDEAGERAFIKSYQDVYALLTITMRKVRGDDSLMPRSDLCDDRVVGDGQFLRGIVNFGELFETAPAERDASVCGREVSDAEQRGGDVPASRSVFQAIPA